MVDPVQLLEGMERMLARRARPIPVHVMRAALRVATEALRGPPSPEQAVAQQLLDARKTAVSARRRRPNATSEAERIERRRARQAAWKREKKARERAAKAAEAAQEGLADAVLAATLEEMQKPVEAAQPEPVAAPPAETVLAPGAGPATHMLVAIQRAQETQRHAAPAPRPQPPAPRRRKDEGETVAAPHKAVREYLIGRLIASGVDKLRAADRVAVLTHDQALEQANERRIAAGLLPFRFLGTQSNGAAA
jgi:hypothetical protein